VSSKKERKRKEKKKKKKNPKPQTHSSSHSKAQNALQLSLQAIEYVWSSGLPRSVAQPMLSWRVLVE
jgi:hypothetical protein